MVYTRTLKAKFDIHPGRVRHPRTSNLRQRYLLSRREHPELVAINPPETSSINTDNAVNFFSNSADASVNSEELEDVSINNDNFEDISSNEDDVPEKDDDFSSHEDDDTENDDDFSQNDDYNPSTQKMAEDPSCFSRLMVNIVRILPISLSRCFSCGLQNIWYVSNLLQDFLISCAF